MNKITVNSMRMTAPRCLLGCAVYKASQPARLGIRTTIAGSVILANITIAQGRGGPTFVDVFRVVFPPWHMAL